MGRGVQEGGIINFMSIRLQESKGHKIVKLQEGGTKTTSGLSYVKLLRQFLKNKFGKQITH